MDTENTRVTREQAAELVGVSPRQINRWSAAGLLTDVRHGAPGSRAGATYDREEVREAPAKWRRIVRETQARRREQAAAFEAEVSGNKPDIST